jgi:hypothetical protein
MDCFASLAMTLLTPPPPFPVIARLDRAIQYAALARLDHACLWDTGSPAFAGDDK